MEFYWYLWNPRPDPHTEDLVAQTIGLGLDHLGFGRASSSTATEDAFLAFWKMWREQFPATSIIYTFTDVPMGVENVFQLRIWNGEPNIYSPSHVGSTERILIAEVTGGKETLREFAGHLVKMPINRAVVKGTVVWRETTG